MTSISFTSGELLDIISALEEKENALYLENVFIVNCLTWKRIITFMICVNPY